MEQELITKIETADISAELKHALIDLGQSLDALLPVVSIPLKRRAPYLFGKLIAEATDATTETHWWETTFDFIAQAARENTTLGQPVLASVERIIPSLARTFGSVRQRDSARDYRRHGVRDLFAQRNTHRTEKIFCRAERTITSTSAFQQVCLVSRDLRRARAGRLYDDRGRSRHAGIFLVAINDRAAVSRTRLWSPSDSTFGRIRQDATERKRIAGQLRTRRRQSRRVLSKARIYFDWQNRPWRTCFANAAGIRQCSSFESIEKSMRPAWVCSSPIHTVSSILPTSRPRSVSNFWVPFNMRDQAGQCIVMP